MKSTPTHIVSGTCGLLLTAPLWAATPEAQEPLPEVVIIAPYAAETDPALVPANVQTASAEDIARSHSLDVTDFLNRNLGSVNINHAQNNPLQPDVNFRGFTASPLLGLPQGISVYQNGVRLNEPFGDTINWDLIPLAGIGSLQMLAGTNPVFGLNTLGGALSLEMKNGFTFEGTGAEIYGGSFSRGGGTVEHGGNNGRWGYYGVVDYFQEDGWRDFSKSDALRFYGALSLRTNGSTLDIGLSYADTELRGNGASPAELLAIDRAQVFTHPDLTENQLAQLTIAGSHQFSDRVSIAGNVFYRDIDTDSFNGDGTIFEECEFGDDEFLVEEDFEDVNGDDECSFDDDDDIQLVLDQNGEPIEAEMDDEELNAVNNIGTRKQESYGASAQINLRSELGGRPNQLLIGTAFNRGDSAFDSIVEVAQLLADRSTSRTGIFADEFRTNVDSMVRAFSVYFADTLMLSDRASLVLSGRYDDTRIELSDRSGQTPELDGKHSFSRFNPAIGATYQITDGVTLYGSYGQAARAPTPVELACASEDAPCNLPNAFLADPPLDQVVAKSFELGLRGRTQAGLRWRAGAFHTINENDILFQTTGGPQANVGFFDNVGDTRRAGIELALSQRLDRFGWSFQYSLIDATFDDAFVVNSPNHPVFEEDEDSEAIVGEGKLLVPDGAEIPGIARHQGNLAVDWRVNDRFLLGADLVVRSGVYLRGDEANLLDKTDGYAIVNLRGELMLGERLRVFARIENLFDTDYETFGLLGEPDEVFETFEDPRFFGAGPPFGAWVGFRLTM